VGFDEDEEDEEETEGYSLVWRTAAPTETRQNDEEEEMGQDAS
jgi:hypothetical protein